MAYNVYVTMKSGAVIHLRLKSFSTQNYEKSGKLGSLKWETEEGGTKIQYMDLEEVAAITYDESSTEMKVFS